MPDTLNAYLIVVFLILPGFIGIKVKRFITASEEPNQGELILSCILFSAWNFIATIWLIKPTLAGKLDIFWGSLLIVLIAPVIQGILFGIIERCELHYRIAEKLRIVEDIKPGQVWDRSFSGKRKLWVRVHISDTEIYEGIASLISLGRDDKELFLTNAKVFDRAGKEIKDLTGAKGIFVNTKDSKIIEIYE